METTEIATRMQKTLDALREDLAKIRSGRAHAGLLDGVQVNCYGADMPLSQLATVFIVDAHTLVVSVWDKQNTATVEKAIRDSDIGVNPATEGETIRVSLPLLSEERRRDLVKLVNKETEAARIAARNIRRDVLANIKAAVKNKEMGEDDGKRLEQGVQKETNAVMALIDSISIDKQKELMAV